MFAVWVGWKRKKRGMSKKVWRSVGGGVQGGLREALWK